jgi:hypothetical protein
MNRFSSARFRRALPLLSLLAVPALGQMASAQTIVTPPAGAPGTVVAIPAGPKLTGTPVIIAAAIDTTGDADTARRALGVANEALKATPGYQPAGESGYAPLSKASSASALKGVDWVWPFTASDYQKIGKATKVPSAMTITVTPGADGSFSAVAKLFRTKDGALTGYGKGNSSATATADTALDEAVSAAVVDLGRTATVNGIIVSKPAGYVARLSLGTISGARAGADIEYLGDDGAPVAYGTIVESAAGESLATVAPETAYPSLYLNQRVRVSLNPTEKRALPTVGKLQEKEFKSFERSFALAAGIATAVYYLAIKD